MAKMHIVTLVCYVVTWHMTARDSTVNGDDRIAFWDRFIPSIVENTKGKNMFCTTQGPRLNLIWTLLGARDKTKDQMSDILKFHEGSQDAVNFMTFLTDAYLSFEPRRLSYGIFLNRDVIPKKQFQEKTIKFSNWSTTMQNVDFGNPTLASKTINDWFDTATEHRFKNVVEPSDLNGDMSMVLVNTITYEREWAEKFNPADTQKRPFYLEDGKKTDIPTMFRSGLYKYGEVPDFDATYIEIPMKPYKSNSMALNIVIPNKNTKLADLEKNFRIIMNGYFIPWGDKNLRKVNLYLPKFEVESKVDLRKTLEDFGMTEIFKNEANFEDLADKRGLKVSLILQKSIFNVNEGGVGKINAIDKNLGDRSAPANNDGAIEVAVDRPFLFFITSSDRSIFLDNIYGRYAEPPFSDDPVTDEVADTDETTEKSAMQKLKTLKKVWRFFRVILFAKRILRWIP